MEGEESLELKIEVSLDLEEALENVCSRNGSGSSSDAVEVSEHTEFISPTNLPVTVAVDAWYERALSTFSP